VTSDPNPYNHNARSETPQGSTPAVTTYTRSAPKSRGIPLDEARLRPHLRQVQPPPFTPGHLDTTENNPLAGITKGKTYIPSPGELRGVPVIGHGGATPGTDPLKQAIKNDPQRDAA
jgi:hypothetical protein